MSGHLDACAPPLYSPQWLRRWMVCADACHYASLLSIVASNFWPLMTGHEATAWLGCVGLCAIFHAGMVWTFGHIHERQDAAVAWLSARSVGKVANLDDARKRRDEQRRRAVEMRKD